jgi:hypothetical protein
MRHLMVRTSGLAFIGLAASLGLAGLSPSFAATTPAKTGTAPAKTDSAASGTATLTPAQKAMIAHVDANLAQLKKTIGVTTGEEASWHGFTQVSRHNALNLADLYEQRSKTLAKMNAVENLESYAAITAKQADDMNALSAAFQTLYGKLTPVQQKKIDAVFRAKAAAMTAKHLKKMKHS